MKYVIELERWLTEHLKKINMRILIMLLLATQIQAQNEFCDSITYWTDQSQGLYIGLDTSNIVYNPDSMTVYWGVCTHPNGVCYTGNGMSDYFSQITTTDTIKVTYDMYVYKNGSVVICNIEDWLVFDGNNWVIYNMNTVGIVEIQNKINNNKMYDLYGREILKPKGLYIQNNQIKYEQ